jgi:hypothetical protein
MNISDYITPEDYAIFAGPDWPSYTDFLAGQRGTVLTIQQEIDRFIEQQRKDGPRFPINTATACQYKWNWSTIYLNMLGTASCHRAGVIPFKAEEFDNFHNLPRKLNDRRAMLKGEWPQGGCQSCEMIERAGGYSDRRSALTMRGITPHELLTNPTAIEVTPTIIEIFAENTCNLSCVYCNASLSSKIEQENIKHGNFVKNNVKIPVVAVQREKTAEYFRLFMDWLNRNVGSLKRLHLLGGETFIQHDLMNGVLDILEKNPNPELALCTFSNLNVPDKYWNEYTGRIRDLQRAGNIACFDLTASIDCWGPEQEYVRSGLNIQKFEQRFAWAAEQSEDWLRLNVNQTITSMTIRSMPDLINKIKQYSKHRQIGHYFQFLGPNGTLDELNVHQHPKQFAYETWANDFERILAAMPQDTDNQREAIPRMQGHQKLLQKHTHHNYKKISELHTYFDELDRRRGTNWRELFPYLDITR